MSITGSVLITCVLGGWSFSPESREGAVDVVLCDRRWHGAPDALAALAVQHGSIAQDWELPPRSINFRAAWALRSGSR